MNGAIPRLSRHALLQIGRPGQSVGVPPAQLLDAPERVLQIGFGNFFRGFLADFVQQAVVFGHFNGRILAVQRKPDRRIKALRQQEGLYTLALRGRAHGESIDRKQIIGSVSRALDAETAWAEVINAAQSPEIKIISTNVSEGGLGLNDRDELQSAPALGLPGKLAQMLFHRWKALTERAEIGIIPCELVDDNGDLLRSQLLQQARRWRLEEEFVSWLRNALHITNTVVDRIVVGAPGGEQLRREWEDLGYCDELFNCAEPYYEFVLQENEFIQRHFPVDRACSNVRYVSDVRPYRARKLLILNGSHTILAAVGRLLGIATVLEAMRDAQVRPFVEAAMAKEIIPAADLPSEMDAQGYGRTVLDRFCNPFVRHELKVICGNASIKVGTRLFPSVRRYMEAYRQVPAHVAAGIASVLLVLRDPEIEDVHAGHIRERWRQVRPEQPQALRDFARDVLCKQMEWTGEQIPVEPVSAAVSQAMAEIEAEGMRTFLGRS